jgi:hypothetical protein
MLEKSKEKSRFVHGCHYDDSTTMPTKILFWLGAITLDKPPRAGPGPITLSGYGSQGFYLVIL